MELGKVLDLSQDKELGKFPLEMYQMLQQNVDNIIKNSLIVGFVNLRLFTIIHLSNKTLNDDYR